MNVISDAASGWNLRVQIAANCCKIRMQPIANACIDPWFAILGAEYNMQNNFAEGLGHAQICTASWAI